MAWTKGPSDSCIVWFTNPADRDSPPNAVVRLLVAWIGELDSERLCGFATTVATVAKALLRRCPKLCQCFASTCL
ncbi:MAG: hypothetical protein AAFZ38_07485 [Myxococcota bacterium]